MATTATQLKQLKWTFDANGEWTASTPDGQYLIAVCDDGTFDVSESEFDMQRYGATFSALREAKAFCQTHFEKGAIDAIPGFSVIDANCQGCGKMLLIENAWMTDGCPCNSPLGVNSNNEMRWRLLMDLQQRQSREIERLTKTLTVLDPAPITRRLQDEIDSLRGQLNRIRQELLK